MTTLNKSDIAARIATLAQRLGLTAPTPANKCWTWRWSIWRTALPDARTGAPANIGMTSPSNTRRIWHGRATLTDRVRPQTTGGRSVGTVATAEVDPRHRAGSNAGSSLRPRRPQFR